MPNERGLVKGKISKNNVCGRKSEGTAHLQTAANSSKAYTFHVYGRSEGVAGVIISDHEYPALVAHQLLSKIVDEFLSKNPRNVFASASANSVTFPQLKEYLVKYQDPQQADSIMKIQKELDETKITLHKTIESVLERGVKLDSLVEKSDGLSAQSKMFYTQVMWRFSSNVRADGSYQYTTGEKAEFMLHCNVNGMDLSTTKAGLSILMTTNFGRIRCQQLLLFYSVAIQTSADHKSWTIGVFRSF